MGRKRLFRCMAAVGEHCGHSTSGDALPIRETSELRDSPAVGPAKCARDLAVEGWSHGDRLGRRVPEGPGGEVSETAGNRIRGLWACKMRLVDRLVREVREESGTDRRQAIRRLKELGRSGRLRREAGEALLGLCRDRLVDPSDLAACAGTVLDTWRRAIERVKPFQREVVQLEWLLDFDYEGLSAEAGELLQMLGYLQGPEVIRALREALELTDPHLKCYAVVSLLRRSEPISPKEIETVAASHLVRITLWENLQALGTEALMPPRWALPSALAASALSRWLSHSNEMGAPPEDIELMDTIRVKKEGDVF